MGELSTSKPNEWLRPRDDGVTLMDRIFNRFDGIYPGKFRATFTCEQAIENWRTAWAEEFAEENVTHDEIMTGLKACKKNTSRQAWPPSLPEFMALCRPPLDYFAGYNEALTMMRYRNSALKAENDREKWSNAAFFWAAVEIGFDMTAAPYNRIERLWQTAVDRAIGKMMSGELPAIVPARPERLEAPERISAAHPKAQAILADLLGKPENKEKQP